jgi:hypothetical protein
MKQMKQMKTYSLILLILLCSSCKKDNTDNPSIIGKWQWIMTSIGDRGSLQTPETVDSTYYIEFNREEYYFQFDNSNNQTVKRKYVLGTGSLLNTFTIGDTNFDTMLYGYTINHDTLSTWMIDDFVGWTYSYKRIK